MKRKRAVKLLMSVGVGRNEANRLMRLAPDLPILYKWIGVCPMVFRRLYDRAKNIMNRQRS